MNPPRKQTYGQILKSSAIIGSSSLVTIFLGAVRTKAMALMLGPSGCSLKAICALLPFERLPKLMQEILTVFRLAPAANAATAELDAT